MKHAIANIQMCTDSCERKRRSVMTRKKSNFRVRNITKPGNRVNTSEGGFSGSKLKVTQLIENKEGEKA